MSADYTQLLKKIEDTYGISFSVGAPPRHLKKLAKLGLPDSIIEFYRSHDPEDNRNDGSGDIPDVSLFSAEGILFECDNAVPSCDIHKHGYIPLAETGFADAYCYDINTGDDPRIILITHEVWFEEMSREEVARYAKPVAKNLHDFLKKFQDGSLDKEPHFPECEK